jgi:hypothetical protein
LIDECKDKEGEIKKLEWEIKNKEDELAKLEKDCEGYVKMKLDMKDRKDDLDAKEKYLRKRFEEAWIKF